MEPVCVGRRGAERMPTILGNYDIYEKNRAFKHGVGVAGVLQDWTPATCVWPPVWSAGPAKQDGVQRKVGPLPLVDLNLP